MSVSYTFNYDLTSDSYKTSSDYSLGNLLNSFDATGTAVVEHGEDNPGGFYIDGSTQRTYLSGDTYAGSSTSTLNYSYSIYAGEGNTLDYRISDHSLSGTIESITIGSGLNKDGTVTNELLTLDFSKEPITADASEGQSSDLHDIVWGLMNSSTMGADSSTTETHDGLQGYLKGLGINLTAQDFGIEDASTGEWTTNTTASLFGETVAIAA